MSRFLIATVALVIAASACTGGVYAYYGFFSEPVSELDVHSDFGTVEVFSDAEGTHPVNSVSFADYTASFYVRYSDKDPQTSSAAVSLILSDLDQSANGSIINILFAGNPYSGKVFSNEGKYKCVINGITAPLYDGHTSVIPVSLTTASEPGHPSVSISFSHFKN